MRRIIFPSGATRRTTRSGATFYVRRGLCYVVVVVVGLSFFCHFGHLRKRDVYSNAGLVWFVYIYVHSLRCVY
jgi:hypothetical protein